MVTFSTESLFMFTSQGFSLWNLASTLLNIKTCSKDNTSVVLYYCKCCDLIGYSTQYPARARLWVRDCSISIHRKIESEHNGANWSEEELIIASYRNPDNYNFWSVFIGIAIPNPKTVITIVAIRVTIVCHPGKFYWQLWPSKVLWELPRMALDGIGHQCGVYFMHAHGKKGRSFHTSWTSGVQCIYHSMSILECLMSGGFVLPLFSGKTNDYASSLK